MMNIKNKKMKALGILITVLMPVGMLFAQGVAMRTMTLSEGVALAKKENKLVLLDFYTEWCGPCKTMNTKVFPQKIMGDYINPRYVFLKFDAEKGEGIDLAKKYQPRGYPTYVILDSQLKEVHRLTGMKNPELFIAELRSVTEPAKSLEAMRSQFDRGDRDRTMLKDYLLLLLSRQDPEKDKVLEILFDGLNEVEKSAPEYWYIYSFAFPGSRYTEYLLDHKDRFYGTIGREKVNNLLRTYYLGDYSSIYYGMRSRPTMDLLTDLDKKIARAGLTSDPVITIYRAAAAATIEGSIDRFLTVFEQYKGQLPDAVAFAKGIQSTLYNSFSKEQQLRFVKLAGIE